jgi:UDP-galactopyranose mutase
MNNNVETGNGAEGGYLPLFGGAAGELLHPDSSDFSSSSLLFIGGDVESEFYLSADLVADGPPAQSTPADETSTERKLARGTLADETLARDILAHENLPRQFGQAGQSSAPIRRVVAQEIGVGEPMIPMSLVGGIAPEEALAEEVVNRALPDLVCLSHLRWDFMYQRPQHLMSRSACERRVFFVEEPVFGATAPRLDISSRDCGVVVVVPHLPSGLDEAEVAVAQQSLLLDELFLAHNISDYILWYYTPMALAFTWHLEPLATVYDCMDELSASKSAPQNFKQREAELLACADVVFASGLSLYEAKRPLHANVHLFPDGVDAAHFRKARLRPAEPADQIAIPRPRLGFHGIIDERVDLSLLAGIADARPDWSLVMIGPAVNVDPAELPQRPNIYYLGAKDYRSLPSYLAGWDVATAPYARNESTRYCSPTKVLEYLAAGVPTISTSNRDVAHPFGQQDLVKVADSPAEFFVTAEHLLYPRIHFDYDAWLKRVDETLATNSWDGAWAQMMQLIDLTVKNRYPDLFVTKPLAASAGLSTGFTAAS